MIKVCTDVHGAGEELLAAYYKFCKAEDEIWLLGDLFDRGMAGHLVWSFLQQPNHFAIKGNHDLKIEAFLTGKRKWLPDHYLWALKNLNEHGVSNEQILNYIQKLPILVPKTVNGKDFILVHAGVCLDDPYREDISINIYGNYSGDKRIKVKIKPVEGREKANGAQFPEEPYYWWDRYNGKPTVLFGHLVCDNFQPRIRNGSIGLDGALVHGKNLLMYCLDNNETFVYSSGIDWYGKFKQMRWTP